MITEDIKKRFFENRDETGRYMITSNVTGRNYYIEPIGDGRMADWGSYNPSTGNVEQKKGAGKFSGSVTENESIITEANGFKNIETLPIGTSPEAEVYRRDKEYELKMVK